MISSESISVRTPAPASVLTLDQLGPSIEPVFSSAPRLVGTRTGWAMRATYFLADVAAIAGSVLVVRLLIELWQGAFPTLSLSNTQLKLDSLLAVGLLAAAAMQHTYAAIPPRPVRQFRGWVLGASLVCASLMGLLWLFQLGSQADYIALTLSTILAIPAASFARAVCRIAFGTKSWWGTRVLVVGRHAARTFDALKREPQWGLRPVGIVDETHPADVSVDLLIPIDQLDNLAAEINVDRALVALQSFDAQEIADLLSRGGGRIRHWIILPAIDGLPSIWLEQCEAARQPAFAVTNRLTLPRALWQKRAFDLAMALVVGLVALPLIVLIALLLRCTSGGRVIYGQRRIGRHGRQFTVWKFRTMVPNADAALAAHLAKHPELAAEWEAIRKLKHDPRVTRLGSWLRAVSLDELPQIWNVLVGDMSLVGPRPLPVGDIDTYADSYQDYIKVHPGITGMWQVSGRSNTTYDERVALDVYYVRNWSLWLDLYILACTVKVVLLSEGAV